MKLLINRRAVLGAILATIFPIVFFRSFRKGAFSVDDPGLIAFFDNADISTGQKIFHNVGANRWRPFADFQYWVSYVLNHKSYTAWVTYNLIILGVISLVLYLICLRLSRSTLIAVSIAVIFATSRFVHYPVIAATGLMELWALLLFLAICYFGLEILEQNTWTNTTVIWILFLFLVLTHERFQGLVVPLGILMLVSAQGRLKWIRSATFLLPPLFLFLMKNVIFSMPPFVGVGSATELGFTASGTLQNLSLYLIQLLGLNFGDSWFVGYATSLQVPSTMIIGISSLATFWALVGVSVGLRCRDGCTNILPKKLLILLLGLLGVIAPAVITSRLELRWVAPGFALILMSVASLVSGDLVKNSRMKKRIVAMILFVIVSSLAMNIRYRDNAGLAFYKASQPSIRATVDVLDSIYRVAISRQTKVYVVDPKQRPDFWKGLISIYQVHSDREVPVLEQIISRDQIPSDVKNPLVLLVADDGSVSVDS